MSEPRERWSPPVDLRLAAITTGALALFVGSWLALHHGWLGRGQIIDTPLYKAYGDSILEGEVPYRDFRVEYPPGALPAFILPAVRDESRGRNCGPGARDWNCAYGFSRTFQRLMVVCAVALLIAVALALAALDAPLAVLAGALALAAVAPLLLGSVVLTRFDLWPAALVAAALAALVSGRFRLGHALLGAGVVVKIWPAVLVPLAAAYVWRTRGRREALVCVVIAATVVLAVVTPFLVIAPRGVWISLEHQLSRPLQIESLGAALIVASHHLFGTEATMIVSRGSHNLFGDTADAVANAQTVLQVGAVVAIWVAFARRERTREELIRFLAAAVVAFVALGKVFSPQFLIWLIPLLPLVRRWSTAVLFAAALVLTQVWFPQRFFDYALRFDGAMTSAVVARDLVLLALLAALLTPDRPVVTPRERDRATLPSARARRMSCRWGRGIASR